MGRPVGDHSLHRVRAPGSACAIATGMIAHADDRCARFLGFYRCARFLGFCRLITLGVVDASGGIRCAVDADEGWRDKLLA
jgi:hypothetical protein